MAPDDVMAAAPAPAGSIADASCVPHPGAGLVGRWGDVLLVVAQADAPVVSELVGHCEAVAGAGGDGRMLSRRLAGMLSGTDEVMPAFAAAAPVEAGVAVFVQGSASVMVGDDFTVSGDESLSWVDRLVPWPVATLRMTTGEVVEPTAGPYNLRNGVIPGSGLTLYADSPTARPSTSAPGPAVDEAVTDSDAGGSHAGSSHAGSSHAGSSHAGSSHAGSSHAGGSHAGGSHAGDSHAGDSDAAMPMTSARDEGEPAMSTPPLDRWPGQAVEPPVFESVIVGVDVAGADVAEQDEPPREALPLATQVSRHQHESTGPSVRGVYCKNGHFNDPRGLFCAVCGINMVQQTPVLTEGPRPPLGVLVLDDGTAFQLDDGYVLGREPTHDDDVQAGRIRGIVVTDEAKTVSRAHARVELREWDVVLIDNGSANGTYVADEGETTWVPVPPGTPHVLTSGTRIRLGSRNLVFNSYRGE